MDEYVDCKVMHFLESRFGLQGAVRHLFDGIALIAGPVAYEEGSEEMQADLQFPLHMCAVECPRDKLVQRIIGVGHHTQRNGSLVHAIHHLKNTWNSAVITPTPLPFLIKPSNES